MTLHAWRIYRVTTREPHAVLGCYLVRGIGYSWECRCGERGKLWKSWREARSEGMWHAGQSPDRLPNDDDGTGPHDANASPLGETVAGH